jgi:hypothetical protein
VRRGHQRALLAILLLEANQRVPVEAITEALWGATPRMVVDRNAPKPPPAVGARGYSQLHPIAAAGARRGRAGADKHSAARVPDPRR